MPADVSILNNVSNVAVWGSLASSFTLSTFMFVQSLFAERRRTRFMLFAALMAIIAIVDFLRPELDSMTYERARVVLWALYPASLLWLFGVRIQMALLVGGLLLGGGEIIWAAGHPELASSLVIPAAFYVAAFAHGRLYLREQGYASCILATFSLLLGLMCSLYYPIVATGNQAVIGLGYLHFALTSIFAVILGWVHLPRELRAKAPVKLAYEHGMLFFSAMVIQEAALQYFLTLQQWPPLGYSIVSVMQAVTASVLYFYNRHQLVIYTDNVSQLLEERTWSLKLAQEELSKQYDIQAVRLDEQAKELEEKGSVIERQRRLELAAQTAGQAAHDIQNLISPLLTWVKDLKRNISSPEYISSRAKDLEQQLLSLLEVNSQMLSLARRGRIERLPISVRELLERLLVMYPEREIQLSCVDAPWMLGSWGQLLRVLSNLITNALEASSDPSAPIMLRCGEKSFNKMQRCHLGFLQPGKYVFIEIQDSGPGIPEETVERIFEPFYSSKTSGHRSGSGLGLTIVSAVVDDLGGTLDLRTGSDGTTFILYFPTVAAPHLAQESTVSRNETILVIDDDSAARTQCEEIFEHAGYTTFTAANGHEALQFLLAYTVDAVILDYAMPGLNGYDTSFGIQNLKPGTPIVIYSSFISDEERIRLMELGTAEIVLKPASPKQLLSVVDIVLSERRVSVGWNKAV